MVVVTIAGDWAANLGLCSALGAFEQGGIFIVPHLLRHGTSVYTVSSERPVPTSHSGIRTPDAMIIRSLHPTLNEFLNLHIENRCAINTCYSILVGILYPCLNSFSAAFNIQRNGTVLCEEYFLNQ
jgi:hypothetical protein